MDIFEQMAKEGKAEGGYIFVSHSRRDLDAVRKLRNALEQAGFEPLCFYLKCMDRCADDPALQEELKSLLRREIDAREWFVYVNSDHSRESSWVEFERECVAKDQSKKVIQLELDSDGSIDLAAKTILKNLRVYISYQHGDSALTERIVEKLVKRDYQVAYDGNVAGVGRRWVEDIQNAIEEASRVGFVLALLSETALQSRFVMEELEYARLNGGTIIPVLLGNAALTRPLSHVLAQYQCHCLPEVPSDADLDRLIDDIGRSIVKRLG